MRKFVVICAALLIVGYSGARVISQDQQWSLNTTVIEACTCPMFCQCYFAGKPAGHPGHDGKANHFCRFNNAYRINKGSYGTTRLDGAKFWLSGDLGADFSAGQTDWAILTYDKAMTKAQRDALVAILPHVFPVKWNSFTTSEGSIDKWEYTNDRAVATLDGGKTAEVRLVRQEGNGNTPTPIVIKNLKYFGAPRNDGFVLMPNEIQAYRVGSKAYESKGTNGFMLTLDMNSKDVPKQKKTTME